MKIIILALAASTFATPSLAQSREETMQRVTETLEALNQTLPADQEAYMALAESGALQDRISEATAMIADLKEYLTGNPYIRVDGFSIVLPLGAAVNFSIP